MLPAHPGLGRSVTTTRRQIFNHEGTKTPVSWVFVPLCLGGSKAAGLKNDADLNQVWTQVQPVLQAQAEAVVGLQTDDEQLAQLHDALSAQLALTEVGLADTAAFRAIVREPEATATLEPTHPPEATATTEPTHPPEASRTPEPTHPPEATNTQVPEPTRTPISPPEASRTPTPGETLEPTQPPEFTNTPTTTPTTGP